MRKIIGIVAAACLVLGLAILLYNPVSEWVSQQERNVSITEFEESKSRAQESAASTEDTSVEEEKYSALLTDMKDYNKSIYESGQTGLADAWSYEQPAFDLSQYGMTTDVIGVLDIPAMGEKLPIYLGATEENLAKGVSVLGQTSMPVGGPNTNCVIAGHRGYGSVAFFREIEKLQPGDFVYLTTYWGEMTYQVESTAIILPDDVEAVLIQEGRELLTLITCHPYVTATHRYVVYCTAVEDEPADDAGAAENNTVYDVDERQTESSSSQSRIMMERWLPFLAIPLVVLAIMILILPSKKENKASGKEERQK